MTPSNRGNTCPLTAILLAPTLLGLAVVVANATPAAAQPPPKAKADPAPPAESQHAITENVGDLDKVLDRVTDELRASLRQKETIVVWLFDASASLRKRRRLVADRLEKIYAQLGATDGDGRTPGLKSIVAAYGAELKLLTEQPVEDFRAIVPLVRSIPEERSGKENLFAAVQSVARHVQQAAPGRNVILIIVTDERGDDDNLLDDAIRACRKVSLKTLVVGNGSLLGQKLGFIRWTYPDKTEEDIAVDGGPESAMSETLNLTWRAGRQADLPRVPSGFGPFALSRLCKETNGSFFIAEVGGPLEFSPPLMRKYQPDYGSVPAYESGLKLNAAKSALVKLAQLLDAQKLELPPLTFRADKEPVLREQLGLAEESAAALSSRVEEMLVLLRTAAKDRDQLREPRWQANYDLALGRVLTTQVRVSGYKLLIASIKQKPFSELERKKKPFAEPGNGELRLVSAEDFDAKAVDPERPRAATATLKRVMDEHPGTPWAIVAEHELKQGMGWQLEKQPGK